jgi:hypothetical protein
VLAAIMKLEHVLASRYVAIPMRCPNRQMLSFAVDFDGAAAHLGETHFLMPSEDPLEDTQTVAIYDFKNGNAQYLHTNARLNPSYSK